MFFISYSRIILLFQIWQKRFLKNKSFLVLQVYVYIVIIGLYNDSVLKIWTNFVCFFLFSDVMRFVCSLRKQSECFSFIKKMFQSHCLIFVLFLSCRFFFPCTNYFIHKILSHHRELFLVNLV